MIDPISRIGALQVEIKAMQTDPLLKDKYGDKVRELMRLRRAQIRKGNKKEKEEE